ncbi:fatty acid CoA ligase family protein [Planctomycetota bacterium]
MVLGGGETLDGFSRFRDKPFTIVDSGPDEPAAILFTTGATGPPKGVIYEHGMFNTQVATIMSYFGIDDTDVDMPAFPLFALFSTAFGIPAVIPDMNPSYPAKCNPAKIVKALQSRHVTTSFGSPAIWDRVSQYCQEKEIKLPAIKRILMAGAPVPGNLVGDFREFLADGADVYTPYGATECLPLACISGREICAETEKLTRLGAGVCVGQPMSNLSVKIIRIEDGEIPEYSVGDLLEQGEIGEIIVKGPQVTKAYFDLEYENRLAKIKDGDGIWHRMGDLGYFDDADRLWVCCRKAHLVRSAAGLMYPLQCEAVFNCHEWVKRSALVGVGPRGSEDPVIIIEPITGRFPATRGKMEHFTSLLLDISRENPLTRPIDNILYHHSFPVDVRHNAKIFRDQLKSWATGQLT